MDTGIDFATAAGIFVIGTFFGTLVGFTLAALLSSNKQRETAHESTSTSDLARQQTFLTRIGSDKMTLGEWHRFDTALRKRSNGMFGVHNLSDTHPVENIVLALRDANLVPPSMTMGEFTAALEQIGKDPK